MFEIHDLFSPEHSIAWDYLSQFAFPWNALRGLSGEIVRLGLQLKDDYLETAQHVWVHKTAVIAPTAYLGAPCIIGPGTEVRHCAFIRGSALVGSGCVVGNSVELKNCILFDEVQVPHFNYVGDSILGWRAHMGAGSVTSNVKSDKKPVEVHDGGRNIETGCRKLGAMLGDCVEIGCNCVLNPGTVIGKNTRVYPLCSVRGVIPDESIVKGKGEIVPILRN